MRTWTSSFPRCRCGPPFRPHEVDELIADFVAEVGNIPHRDYLEFMRRHNGCDGPIGQNGYIRIWPLEHFYPTCSVYPQWRQKAAASDGVIRSSRNCMLAHRSATVRSSADRKSCLSLENAGSMGL